MIIASPIAASAAATVRTINTKICPFTLPKNEENATNDRLMAFSISSMLIKIIIAFLLIKTPKTPIENKIAESKRYRFKSIIKQI